MRISSSSLASALALGLAVLAFAPLGACGGDDSNASPSTGTDPGDEDAGEDDDAGPTDPGSQPDGGSDGEGPAVSKVDVTNETLDVGGQKRKYTLAVPKTYDATRAYPLVLFLHGDGGTGPSMRKSFTFDDVTGDDAIVAYPSGNGTTWDLGTDYDDNADQQFLVALVDALAGKFDIDTSRVFGAGYSSGGFMVNQMACRRPGLFRGINVYAGGAPYEGDNPPLTYPSGYVKCPGEQPVAAFVVHGTADGTVDPSSGEFDAEYWRYVNGCDESRSPTTPSPCEAYDGCPTGFSSVYCLVPGLNHFPWMPGAKAAWAMFKTL
jgi:polyhydroxybutyrate depolymerase